MKKVWTALFSAVFAAAAFSAQLPEIQWKEAADGIQAGTLNWGGVLLDAYQSEDLTAALLSLRKDGLEWLSIYPDDFALEELSFYAKDPNEPNRLWAMTVALPGSLLLPPEEMGGRELRTLMSINEVDCAQWGRRQVFLAAFTGYFGMGEMFESVPDPAFLIIPPQADMSFGIELVCEP